MLGRTDRRLRLVALLAAFVVMASALAARLAYWQVARGSHLQELALAQLETRTEEPLPRGEIVDRTGSAILATNAYRDMLVAFPTQIPRNQRDAVARRVSRMLGWEGAAADRVGKALRTNSSYLVLASQV